jgi:hypothetical protein
MMTIKLYHSLFLKSDFNFCGLATGGGVRRENQDNGCALDHEL